MFVTHRYRLVLCSLALAALLLGACSIYPFTQLLLPWVVLRQWTRVAFPVALDSTCVEAMTTSGSVFSSVTLPAEQTALGCAIETPLRITSAPLPFVNIAFEPPFTDTVLSCHFALQLRIFIDRELGPEAERLLGSKAKLFLHKGGYACRGQRSMMAIRSEHAFGEAMDFAGVELEDGRRVLVEADYLAPSPAGEFLRSVAAKGCEAFGTVLGPPYDERHKDHLHFAIGFPNRCVY